MGLFDDKRINDIIEKLNENSEAIQDINRNVTHYINEQFRLEEKVNIIIFVLTIYFVYKIFKTAKKFTIKKR